MKIYTKSSIVLFIIAIFSGCILIDYNWNVSNNNEFKNYIGVHFCLNHQQTICIRKKNDNNINFHQNSLNTTGSQYSNITKITIRKGSQIIIDKVYLAYRGGYKSYYAVGRVFQDEEEIEYEFYLGMEGYGELEFPPMTPVVK